MPQITEEDRLERQKSFIEKAKSIHGDRFDYSKVYYVNKFTKVCILLGKRELWQRPWNHFNFKGRGKDYERRYQKNMTEDNWKWHKKSLKKRNRHNYWVKCRESEKWRSEHKKREFCKVRTYKCVFCGDKFRRKESGIGYIGQYCSKKCLMKHTTAKRVEEILKYKFLIISTEFRKKKEIIEEFISKEDAVTKFKEIIEENKKITLPQKYVLRGKRAVKLNREILLIERSEDDTVALLEKNELGKLINTKIKANAKYNNFIIIDKQSYHSEQKFNIINNNSEIDVNYIINNILLSDNEGKHIMIYDKNLIIKTENDIELILSEHQYIIMDLYNFLQSYCTENKVKYIMFMGIIDNSPMLVDYYDKKIQEKMSLRSE